MNVRRRIITTCVTVIAAVTATALSAQPGSAATTTGSTRVVLNVPGHGRVVSSTGGVKSRSVSPRCCGSTNLNPSASRTITPPGGTTDTIQASGHSYAKVPLPFETSANFTSNASTVSWLGGRPINATAVTQTDNWHTDGISISVSVSWPPGIGFSGSGSDASWTTTVKNTWKTTHSWDSVKFSAADIYRVHYNVSGSFQFGSSFYGVSATSSNLV